MDSFESRLRLALAQDRADYAAAPGMQARVHRVTRRRAVQRRTALGAGVAVVALAVWVPLQAGLFSATAPRGNEAVTVGTSGEFGPSPVSEQSATLPRPTGIAGSRSTGTPGGRPHGAPNRGAAPLAAPRPDGKRTATPPATGHQHYPVVKMAKKADPKVDLIPITTATASAVASISAGDSAVPEAGLAEMTVLCAVEGPEKLLVGETGTWTATAPGATDAHWATGDPASSPHVEAFAAPGTYEIVLEVNYAGVASMRCHRSLTVEAPPATDPAATDPPAEPEPAQNPTDPGPIDNPGETSGGPSAQSIEGTAGPLADGVSTADTSGGALR